MKLINITISTFVGASFLANALFAGGYQGVPADITDVITQNKMAAKITMQPMYVLLISIGSEIETPDNTDDSTSNTSEPVSNTPIKNSSQSSSGGSLFYTLLLLISTLVVKM